MAEVTKKYPNFYESIKEARMRIEGTIVLYDEIPFYILRVFEHSDGIFRVYMEELSQDMSINGNNPPPVNVHPDNSICVDETEKWMKKWPNKIVRKMMNSPKFNMFRPFSLGYCHVGDKLIYLQRQPLRRTEQGLSSSMIIEYLVNFSGADLPKPSRTLHFPSQPIREAIIGKYPTLQECVSNLMDPQVTNKGAAFHRDFAILRGPIETLFLIYQESVVGFIENHESLSVKLSKKYVHLREKLQELGQFRRVS